jgi:hypothetical protein
MSSKSTTPSEKMSERASTSCSPRACSGDMYAGVPMAQPSTVSAASPSPRAVPRSMTMTLSASSREATRKKFDGLTSRWMMPASCRPARPSAAWRPTSMASATLSGRHCWRRFRSSPSSHSSTRQGVPSASTPWAM